MSKSEKWRPFLEQIRIDGQNNHEAFFNLAYLMAEKLNFPLMADWLGESVLVTAVTNTYSSHSHSLKMDAAEIDEPLSIEELAFIDADQISANWIDFHHYWREETK